MKKPINIMECMNCPEESKGQVSVLVPCPACSGKPCKLCGHDINDVPAEDVKREELCFPCEAGRLALLKDELVGALNIYKKMNEKIAEYLAFGEGPETDWAGKNKIDKEIKALEIKWGSAWKAALKKAGVK